MPHSACSLARDVSAQCLVTLIFFLKFILCLTGMMQQQTVFRCPCCNKPLETESALLKHLEHHIHKHSPCFMLQQLGARSLTWFRRGMAMGTGWKPLTGNGTGGKDRLPSPDPDDDMKQPPDVNEDDLVRFCAAARPARRVSGFNPNKYMQYIQ